jgi:hypothetical protein
MQKIVKIEFYPDFGSTGFWLTYDNSNMHTSVEIEEFPEKLPEWFEDKLLALNMTFDYYADDEEAKAVYGFDNKIDYEWMEHQIIVDFKMLCPKYAHLVEYTLDNPYAPKEKKHVKPTLTVVK